MTRRGEVLVSILNNLPDMTLALARHWYRIPSDSVSKFLKNSWPPKWLAFYQTKVFGSEAYAVNYYARVGTIREVCRWELFPDQPEDSKSQRRYYKLELSTLSRLEQPIISRRLRRITFIPTTWEKFTSASEINDLWDESPLEDRLWVQFKRLQIGAERQEVVKVKRKTYFLDFAIYCVNGKIDVETDGDTWHADKKRIPADNERDNDLQTVGWRTLRFNTHHLQEWMAEYCIPAIAENINKLGGLESGKVVTRQIKPDEPQWQQLSLF